MSAGDTETTGGLGRVLDAARSLLGLHRRFVVDGVRYTERGAEPLRRALSRRGSGRKDYDVTFPGGATMRIRATPWREYADLGTARMRPVYATVERLVRPGMRVLDAASGTGYGAAWLVERVGPSGAVVALERDRESVRYAGLRYGAPNAAFEHGWLEALAGETDASFDGVVCCDAVRDRDDPDKTLRELWRLVAPGGWMLVAAPVPGHGEGGGSDGQARAFTPEQMVALISSTTGAGEPAEGRAPEPQPDADTGEPTDAGGRLVVLVRRPDR